MGETANFAAGQLHLMDLMKFRLKSGCNDGEIRKQEVHD